MNADEIIAHLNLEPHPEGGHYHQTWIAEGPDRPAGTCIYFLLKADGRRPLLDLTFLRQFIGSNGLQAIFDLPWVPIYLAILFLLHVQLGVIATGGVVIVLTLTIVNEMITKSPIAETTNLEFSGSSFSEINTRNAESIIAMGMTENVTRKWEMIRNKALVSGQTVSGRTGRITALTKTIHLILQSGILAVGGYLAIFQEITPGTMIAGSILAGRALAPIDLAIGNWKNFIKARQSFDSLHECLADFDEGTKTRPILQGISFRLEPGDGLGVIGPSVSGKSSLARILVGLWNLDRGEFRLDGASYSQWDKEKFGVHIGYLPQIVELLPGTIAENIARFDQDVKDNDIIG